MTIKAAEKHVHFEQAPNPRSRFGQSLYVTHLNHLGQRVVLFDETGRPLDLLAELPDPREGRRWFESEANMLANRVGNAVANIMGGILNG